MKTLFDYPASHNKDPVTSYEAEEKVTKSGKRSRQAMEVFEVLKRHNGSTSAELGFIMNDRYLPARRLPDLEKAGLVKRGIIRECLVCKYKCVTWLVKGVVACAQARICCNKENNHVDLL